MKRVILLAGLLLSAGAAGSAFADPFRFAVELQGGTASSTFGLSSAAFDVPVQNNSSVDGIISATLEYLLAHAGPLDLGLAARGSFALSGWNLGTPGVWNGSYYDYTDAVHLSTDWWALAAMVTLHIRLGQYVLLDGAVGYGPYGYGSVSYWDDYGYTAGPVVQSPGFFPGLAYSIDWSAGLSFRIFRFAALSLDVGMMGPDFVSGLGIVVPL
jgi:hypothetical protein